MVYLMKMNSLLTLLLLALNFYESASKSCCLSAEDLMTNHFVYNYTGSHSKTIHGLTCQKWNLNHPHRVSPKIDAKWVADQDHNHCRQPPGMRRSKPWCYTDSDSKQWDFCAINYCSRKTYALSGDDGECLSIDTAVKRADGMFDYQGTMSTAAGGIQCRTWSQYSDLFAEELRPWVLKMNHNYCRQIPGAPNNRPYCIVNNPKVPFMFCDIPFCAVRDIYGFVPGRSQYKDIPDVAECIIQ